MGVVSPQLYAIVKAGSPRDRNRLIASSGTPRPADGSRHLVGIAMDVTEQRRLAEFTATADMRLRDAVEAISEAFVLWDAGNRLVLCNSKFRDLHALSSEDAVPGRRYDEIMGQGALPPVRRGIPGPERGTSRTFEVELTDGRWLQVSERRTKDGPRLRSRAGHAPADGPAPAGRGLGAADGDDARDRDADSRLRPQRRLCPAVLGHGPIGRLSRPGGAQLRAA